MKNWWIRIALFLSGLGALVVLTHSIPQVRDQYWQSHKLTFTLPFPDEVIKTAGLPQNITYDDIKEVYLAGDINDWNLRNPAYELTQNEKKEWVIHVRFYKGDNPYKFVVYLNNRVEPIMTYDQSNPRKTGSHFGGKDSVIVKKDLQRVLELILMGVWILFSLFVVYILLDLITILVYKYQLGIRSRMAFMVLSVSLLALVFTASINIHKQRVTAREGIIDSLNLLHLFLQGRGIDFEHLSAQVEPIRREMDTFYPDAKARVKSNSPSNLQIFFSTLLLFDKDLKLLDVYKRKVGISFTRESMKKLGYDDMNNYYQEYIFKDLIQNMRQTPGKKYETQFSLLPPGITSHYSWKSRVTASVLGMKIVIHPIYVNQTLVGYYGATIHTKLYGQAITSMLFLNILSGVLVAVFLLLYFLVIQKNPEDDYLIDRFFKKFKISKREQDVIHLLFKGYSNQDISDTLIISEGTVKSHIYHVFQKAGINNRMELIGVIKEQK